MGQHVGAVGGHGRIHERPVDLVGGPAALHGRPHIVLPHVRQGRVGRGGAAEGAHGSQGLQGGFTEVAVAGGLGDPRLPGQGGHIGAVPEAGGPPAGPAGTGTGPGNLWGCRSGGGGWPAAGPGI